VTERLRGVRVLVTGAGGFIGSHLVESLVATGAGVRALVHYNARNDWGHLEDLPDEMRGEIEIVTGDLRDPFLVERAVAGVEIVFHLGAVVPIPYSYVAPAHVVATNVTGTLNVLEAGRRHAISRLVHTSSSEVYGSARYTPIDERHPLHAQSPYAASKIAADKLVESYGHSFGVPAVTVRPFNAYGPRQSARAFVPSVLAQMLTGDVVRVGSLDPVRDMSYVSDTVEGFLRAARAPGIEGLTLNLGTGTGYAMRDLLDRARAIVGRACRVEVDPDRRRPEASEVVALVCDAALAKQTLEWEPRVTLDDGLRRTASWIEAHLGRFKPRLYNL